MVSNGDAPANLWWPRLSIKLDRMFRSLPWSGSGVETGGANKKNSRKARFGASSVCQKGGCFTGETKSMLVLDYYAVIKLFKDFPSESTYMALSF